MITKQLALVMGLGFAAASLVPAAASAAAEGWTIRGVSQRAGPGRDYPKIGYVPEGAHVRIFGCVRGVRSCDISWRGNRGWVNGNALAGFYRGRQVPLVSFYIQIGVPYVGFDFDYWDRHYRNKPFFHQRDRWWAEKDWKKYGSGGDNWNGKKVGRGEGNWEGKKEWDSLGQDGKRPGWCGPNSNDPRCSDDEMSGRDGDGDSKKWKKPQGQLAGEGRRGPKGQKADWCGPNSDDEECAAQMQ